MLKINLLHPEILSALARNGHGSKILIADGNFPISTKTPSSCKRVFLNLAPDLLTVTDVLRVIKDYIPIEKYLFMTSPDETEHPVYNEFKMILGEIPLQKMKRFDFYQEASSADVCLAIATGETRRFANIILETGVVRKA